MKTSTTTTTVGVARSVNHEQDGLNNGEGAGACRGFGPRHQCADAKRGVGAHEVDDDDGDGGGDDIEHKSL